MKLHLITDDGVLLGDWDVQYQEDVKKADPAVENLARPIDRSLISGDIARAAKRAVLRGEK